MEQYYFDFKFDDENAGKTRKFLEFYVTDRMFAVSTDEVVEIVQYGDVSPVPEFPEYVKGIATVNGRTVAVIDTAKRFKYERTSEDTSRRCIVIASVTEGENAREIGIIADNVVKIRDVEEEKLLPPPEVNSEAFTRYITGMFIRTDDTPCFIVSPTLMMSEEEQEVIFEK